MKRLVGIVAAAATAALVLLGIQVALPPQDAVDTSLDYHYVGHETRAESVAFAAAASRDDTYLMLGSSELATMPELVSTAPDRLLREYDCGYQLMLVGEAYDQSLWMAIAAGAYADAMPNRKLAIIVSSQWFFDGGLEPGIFKMRFSFPLYDEFCKNESISDETKAYVAQRLLDEGVDGALVDAGVGDLPQDALNRVAFEAMGDLKIRNLLENDVRGYGMSLPWGTEPPDFDALRVQAAAEGAAACTTNDFGMYDAYWKESVEPVFYEKAGSMADETLSITPEYGDLQCMLDVCNEAGLEPCVIIMPVNGKWYDHLGLTKGVRDACCQRIGAMCADAGVECLDLSVHDYDDYYLRDAMHFGWLGWLDVEEHLMGFFAQDDAGEGVRP